MRKNKTRQKASMVTQARVNDDINQVIAMKVKTCAESCGCGFKQSHGPGHTGAIREKQTSKKALRFYKQLEKWNCSVLKPGNLEKKQKIQYHRSEGNQHEK